MKSPTIEVVVPVYNALTATKKCLSSLARHNPCDTVVLIDDGSDDRRMSALLNDYVAKYNHWTLLSNNNNLGFVKTANRGLQLSQEHTVLLNSDALVSAGWLQRIRDCIQAIPNLATATPWSNNAEICSLPKTLCNNPLPKDIDKLAQALSKHHQPQYPELPTAVGFCMLITAQAKRRVGYFNAAVFGMGYGEENDYSLRSSALGLRNVLVDNAYVAHTGNQSFGEKQLQPNEATMARLLALHPDYAEIIDQFIKNDPLNPIRQSIIDKIDCF